MRQTLLRNVAENKQEAIPILLNLLNDSERSIMTTALHALHGASELSQATLPQLEQFRHHEDLEISEAAERLVRRINAT